MTAQPFSDLDPVLQAFQLSGEPRPLPGGSTDVYLVQDIVLKNIAETSLENNHSPELAAWIADLTTRIPQEGFRLPMPLKTKDGSYITPDGWIASRYLTGRRATVEDIPACIQAINALHRATAGIPKHPLMDDNHTPWGFGQRGTWGDKPGFIQPRLRPLLDALYILRQPIPTSPWQLIHGDLNLGNFLITPGQPPAVLDFSPYWEPPEFALAIFANFSGPRCWDLEVLRHFMGIPHFDQLLVRACIRMLLIMSEINWLDGWETCSEKWAAEQVIRIVSNR